MRGDRLREIREARQLSQKDLGDLSGIHQQQIYKYEKGDSDPTADTLTRIAQVLEVSTDYLLGLVDSPNQHLNEEELSPMERKLIQAVRRGLIVEALKTLASLQEGVDQASIPPNEPAINR